eukprot:2301377-Prymnesium_polylepis.1
MEATPRGPHLCSSVTCRGCCRRRAAAAPRPLLRFALPFRCQDHDSAVVATSSAAGATSSAAGATRTSGSRSSVSSASASASTSHTACGHA